MLGKPKGVSRLGHDPTRPSSRTKPSGEVVAFLSMLLVQGTLLNKLGVTIWQLLSYPFCFPVLVVVPLLLYSCTSVSLFKLLGRQNRLVFLKSEMPLVRPNHSPHQVDQMCKCGCAPACYIPSGRIPSGPISADICVLVHQPFLNHS